MNDILPDVSATWQLVESIVCDVIESYGYREIRLPVLEHTEVFARAIGDATDIVEKEMYTFRDRNDESLTMRPEATAGMVRAGIGAGIGLVLGRGLLAVGPTPCRWAAVPPGLVCAQSHGEAPALPPR